MEKGKWNPRGIEFYLIGEVPQFYHGGMQSISITRVRFAWRLSMQSIEMTPQDEIMLSMRLRVEAETAKSFPSKAMEDLRYIMLSRGDDLSPSSILTLKHEMIEPGGFVSWNAPFGSGRLYYRYRTDEFDQAEGTEAGADVLLLEPWASAPDGEENPVFDLAMIDHVTPGGDLVVSRFLWGSPALTFRAGRQIDHDQRFYKISSRLRQIRGIGHLIELGKAHT